MKYTHCLTKQEIERDVIIVYAVDLPPDVHEWFRGHTNQSIEICDSNGTVLRKSSRIQYLKHGKWQIACGIGIFETLSATHDILLTSHSKGELIIDITAPPRPSIQQHLIPPSSSKFNSSRLRQNSLFPRKPVYRPGLMGKRLDFRGLQHAPVNEQGVVFLFGMICQELGFLIEVVRSEYPDCEGKRLINRNPEQWERVRIEFEFRSKNFKKHKHDPDGCDLIVCWENDWKGCPIEVLELKSIISNFAESGIFE